MKALDKLPVPYLNHVLFILGFILCSLTSYAESDKNAMKQSWKITDQSFYIEAGNSLSDIQDVLKTKKGEWSRVSKNGFAKPNGENAYWVKFKMPKIDPGVYYVTIGENDSENLSMWSIDSRSTITEVEIMLDNLNINNRKIKYRTPTFKVTVADPNSEIFIYVYEKVGTLVMPISLHTENAFLQDVTKSEIQIGINFGILLLLILIALISRFFFNDILYILLATYLFGISLAYCSLLGIGSTYIWPNIPGINPYTSYFGVFLCMTSFSFIAINFLKLKSQFNLGYLLLSRYTILIGIIFMIGSFLFYFMPTPEVSSIILYARFTVTLFPVLIIYVCLNTFFKTRDPNSLWLCSLFIITLISLFIGSLIPYGIVPVDSTKYLLWLASIEGTILMFVIIREHFKIDNDKVSFQTQIRTIQENLSNTYQEGVNHQRQLISFQLINKVNESLIELKKKDDHIDEYDRKQLQEIDRLSQYIRNTAHRLNSDALTRYGLVNTIEKEIFKIESNNNELQINFTKEGELDDINQEISELMYQSFLEMCSTILENTDLKKVDIILSNLDNRIALKISDSSESDNSKSNAKNRVFDLLKDQANTLGGIFQTGFLKGNYCLLELKPFFSNSINTDPELPLALSSRNL